MQNQETHIAILICTAQRPKMLIECLQSIAEQIIPENVKMSVVVVENDSEAPSKDKALKFAKSVFRPKNINFIFAVESKRGIPMARNRTLKVCYKLKPDFVALIDDDEIAASDWIITHIEAQQEFQADIVRGPVIPIYNHSTPFAVTVKRKMKDHGKLLKTSATGNVFFKFFIIDPNGLNLKFDERFKHGHEDTEFFERAYKMGMRIINNEKSIVNETIPQSKTRYLRFFMRNLQYGAVLSYELILKRGWFTAFRKQVFQFSHIRRLIASTIVLLLALLLWPFSKKKYHRCMIYALKRYGKVFGTFYGLTGRQIEHWNKIDGY